MKLGEAAAPPGLRLYAIGDVHGCDDLLAAKHAAIAADLKADPPEDHRIIHLGDYVDRGPESRGVVERLSRLMAADPRVICLRGNHEDVAAAFLSDPVGAAAGFLAYGGVETLASYGIPGGTSLRPSALLELRDRFRAALPAAHAGFLTGRPHMVRLGDYLFVHAGIRPGVALERQSPEDLTWIREPFLHDRRDHGFVVVHGHTPCDAPELRPNRIGIDTGAFFTGRLTCVVLEGKGQRFL